MRKYKYLFSIFILSFIISQSLFAEENTFRPFTGKVIGEKVRLRTNPDTDSHVITQLGKDTLLLVLGEKNDYYAVKPFDSSKAYVFRNYIVDNTVEANRVNVRLKPDLNAPILGQLQSKQKVEGIVCSKDNKWLEINLPDNIYYYVSKEYLTKVGDSTYYVLMQDRKEEVTNLLNSAFFLTQAECKKPFNEMDPKKAISQFEAIIKGYSDFSDCVQQAKEGLALLQDNYLQKKIVYLETKANMVPEEKEDLFREVASLCATAPIKNSYLQNNNNNNFSLKNLTTKMKSWVSLEKELYSTWTTFHPEKSIEDFYNEQKANAITVTGVIEAFDQNVKNKPGDFILKGENVPTAFLYSIHVDLEKLVGKQVRVTVSPRPNNNFAFPAYFVNTVE